ncbi:hypothetical protein K1719_034919 [Acacia pycnantha]|nr:hypothetical protein K1719_034919 [Acacia pycnantha]
MRVKTEFKVSEKRWYWLKVFALATIKDWAALEKFSKEKKPPIGYRPFVEACVEADEKAEALKSDAFIEDFMVRISEDSIGEITDCFARNQNRSQKGNPIDWVSTHSLMSWLFDTKSVVERCGEPDNVGDLEKQSFYRFLRSTYILHPLALGGLLYAMGGFPFLVWGMGVRVVFGDVGTSPLYTFSVIFKKAPIDGNEDILGALSLVLYTLILFPLLKYVLVVLWANDGGEGYDFPSPFQYNIMFGVQKRSVTMMIAGQIHVPSTEDEEDEKMKQKREADEMGDDAMKSLENRTLDSKREMDILAALDEMKSMKEEERVIEAKIRMRQQELQNKEERISNAVAASSISVVEGEEMVTSQDSCVTPIIRPLPAARSNSPGWRYPFCSDDSNVHASIHMLSLAAHKDSLWLPFSIRLPKDEEDEKMKQKREADEMGDDAMKSLENRTLDSKREMDILAALDEMKSMKEEERVIEAKIRMRQQELQNKEERISNAVAASSISVVEGEEMVTSQDSCVTPIIRPLPAARSNRSASLHNLFSFDDS